MEEISIRELRNHGGEIIDRVERGERLTVTRNGRPVAELRPLARRPTSIRVIIEKASHLPPLDPARLREDLDRTIDPTL